jgi:primase-polymerase (primpol)-like protein
MSLDLGVIPDDLKRWNQWVTWRYQQRGSKKTKPPLCPATGTLASVDAPGTWGTYEEACTAYLQGRYDGVAFIITFWDPFTGIDLDHVIEASGQIASWGRAIVDHFASYTEWSPSRAGLHIWVRGALPGIRRRKDPVEVYDSFRCLTLTGWHLEGTPHTIEERQPELESFYQHLFKDEAQRQVAPAQPQISHHLSDADLLARAARARNGARFAHLWAGDTSDYGEDRSRADLALCGMLAFWTGGDAERMDRLFRRSGLFRDKWDEQRGATTDGQRTIGRALTGRLQLTCPGQQQPAAYPLYIPAQKKR